MSISTLAQSEKHLEDWIVANQDRIALGHYPANADPPAENIRITGRVIGRQVRLPSGRLDLLTAQWGSLTVVELKKGTADSHTFAQVMRYMNDMKEIQQRVQFKRWNDPDFSRIDYRPQFCEPPLVNGLIVCQGFADKRLQFSCMGNHITVIQYRYIPETDWYSFSNPDDDYDYGDLLDIYDDFAHGFIGQEFLTILEEVTENSRRGGLR